MLISTILITRFLNWWFAFFFLVINYVFIWPILWEKLNQPRFKKRTLFDN